MRLLVFACLLPLLSGCLAALHGLTIASDILNSARLVQIVSQGTIHKETIHKETISPDTLQLAAKPTEDGSKATIHILRSDNEGQNSVAASVIHESGHEIGGIDGRKIGVLASGGRLSWEALPGTKQIYGKTSRFLKCNEAFDWCSPLQGKALEVLEDPDNPWTEVWKTNVLTITIKAGTTYYLLLKKDEYRAKIEQISPEEAKVVVLQPKYELAQ